MSDVATKRQIKEVSDVLAQVPEGVTVRQIVASTVLDADTANKALAAMASKGLAISEGEKAAKKWRAPEPEPEVTDPPVAEPDYPADWPAVVTPGTAAAAAKAPHQFFKPLPLDIEGALRASIQRFGVLVPVMRDQHGDILDGHNRQRIADELEIPVPETTIHVEEGERELVARTLNAVRRQLTAKDLAEQITYLSDQGHSTRAIAGALSIGKTTVHRAVTDAAPSPSGTVERVTGLDGRSRPKKSLTKAQKEERNNTIDDLIESGMSEADVATAVGVAASTVHRIRTRHDNDPAPASYEAEVNAAGEVLADAFGQGIIREDASDIDESDPRLALDAMRTSADQFMGVLIHDLARVVLSVGDIDLTQLTPELRDGWVNSLRSGADVLHDLADKLELT